MVHMAVLAGLCRLFLCCSMVAATVQYLNGSQDCDGDCAPDQSSWLQLQGLSTFTEWTMEVGGVASGDDQASKAICPSGYTVVFCQSDPPNAGDGLRLNDLQATVPTLNKICHAYASSTRSVQAVAVCANRNWERPGGHCAFAETRGVVSLAGKVGQLCPNRK